MGEYTVRQLKSPVKIRFNGRPFKGSQFDHSVLPAAILASLHVGRLKMAG